MRVKIQTNSPLPPLKAWYATKSLEGPNPTIADLKKQICTNVDAIRAATKGRAAQLTLTLDDFELLDVSPLDVLRDGDLIVIGLNSAEEQATSSHLGKRKRSSSVKTPLKYASKQKPPPSHSTSSSSSDLSESDSESTETESDSDSSDSDSDSSDDEPPPIRKNAKPTPLLRPTPPQPATSREPLTAKLASTNNVPPGQGLPRTQNRNKRRRVKRQAERQSTSAPPPPPPGASSVNTLPIPTKRPAADVVYALNNAFSTNDQSGTLQPGDLAAISSDQATGHQTENEQIAITMSSLKNKNKKKGFKNASNRPIPQKIVFSDVANSKDDVEMAIVDNILHTEKRPLPRVIPPSENQARGELPPNMFVTSVDVEAEEWTRDDKPRPHQEELQELPYGDPDPPAAQSQPRGRFDWAAAEIKLSQGKSIASHEDLCIGMHIGKTDLGINPVTFTPEFLLTVARITATTPNVLAKLLIRPGTADISFSKAAKFAVDEVEEVVEEIDEEGEELAFTSGEMSEWRILDI
ncbi:hypothetical protein CCMSSC00406_0005324 [Pleurotus cornucopiae]|uniref:Uncharacterized protein n=1 Tax=Pleurotus cornucopiae TaxID=5321 RepID=A0ACB7INA9_PLECO|nr:hypothetical protein CCMSSC00406_0005324 [Pleurotus cornucopiae]